MNPVNKLLEENKEAIVKLRKFHSSNNLTNMIKNLFPNESGGFYFQIKSEIMRLSKPCNRIIDLRNKLKNEDCDEFEFNGIRHYLNESGLKTFKSIIAEYKDQYTFGVYEGVMEEIKILQQKEIVEINNLMEKIEKKEEEIRKNLSVVKFSNYHARKEERMHFAVAVKIYEKTESKLSENIKKIRAYYNRNEFLEHETGITTNISFSGAGIKVNRKIDFTKGQRIIIRLTGMEEDFVISQPFIEYEVMHIEEKGKFNYISLRKIDDEENKEVDLYIRNLINSHKKRYKVSLDNVIESAYAKGHEQYYVSRLNCLPIYFEHHNKELLPKYAFVNDVNIEGFNYFKYGSKKIFEQVIKHSNIEKFINPNKDNSICYLATFFIERDGMKHFYCLSTNDCNNKRFKKFLSYASKRDSLHIYKAEFIKTNAVKDCFVPSALPKDILKNVMPHELRLSPKIERLLEKINILGIFTEVTHNFNNELVSQIKVDKNDIPFLQSCQIKELKSDNIELIKAETNDFRAEDRFLIQSQITLKSGLEKIKGITADLSTKGFRARLDKSANVRKGDKVLITFDDYTHNDFVNVKELEYKIVYKQNDIIACKMVGDAKKHNGAIFWKKYIYSNYYKLRTTGNSHEVLGFSKALRNIFTRYHNNLPCFFELRNKQVNPFLLSLSYNLHERFELFEELNLSESEILTNIRPIFFNHNFLEVLEQSYSEINKDNPYISLKYFVNLKKMGTSGRAFYKVFFENQLGCNREIKDFLNPEDGSQTFVFELQITKKSRVFNKYFKNEISYIESYAAYKAEDVLAELKRIAGIVELKDITNIIKSQYN